MKKKILIIVILVVILVGIYYVSNGNDDIVKTISYNGNNLRISIDGDISSTLPTSGAYYLVDYDCKSPNTKIEWDKTNYKLNISNGTKKGGVVCNLVFKSKPFLSEMQQGSYVKYVGDSNNGCDNTNEVNGWTSCAGKNANYESDINMGYCYDEKYKFYFNGWRIGYIEDGNAHLVSAGAPDCMCSNSSGDALSIPCNDGLSNVNIFKHYENMNNLAFKYCNKDYAKGGMCITNSIDNNISNTVWGLNAEDFKKITGSVLSKSSCVGSEMANRYACGFRNDLIDNGSRYWYAVSDSWRGSMVWAPNSRAIVIWDSLNLLGVRPVLALESSVIVTGGDGTYESPYEISNYSFYINDDDGHITDSNSKSNLELILSGSDVSTMCISVNTSVCTNYVNYNNNYILDLSGVEDGEHFIYVYYKDSNENIVASMNKSVIIDTSS